MQDEGVGALQSDNYILVWPRKVWTSRVVPYQISGHHADNIRKFILKSLLNIKISMGQNRGLYYCPSEC